MKRRRQPLTKKCAQLFKTQSPDWWMWIGVASVFVILLALVFYCGYNSRENEPFYAPLVDAFQSVSSNLGGNGELKELDILYFMSPTCPWCQKMTKVLKDEGALESVTIVDVTKPEGQKIAKETGSASRGVPSFISRSRKTGTVGFKKSVSELINSLNKKKGPGPKPNTPSNPRGAAQDAQDLQIMMFASPTCSWCNKAKSEMNELGVLDMVEIVDVSTETGKKVAQEVLKEMRGVPAFASRTTGKTSVGYRPFDQLILNLK